MRADGEGDRHDAAGMPARRDAPSGAAAAPGEEPRQPRSRKVCRYRRLPRQPAPRYRGTYSPRLRDEGRDGIPERAGASVAVVAERLPAQIRTRVRQRSELKTVEKFP